MWPFSKKAKDLAQLPPMSSQEMTWGVTAAEDGSPLIVRFNSSVSEWAAHPALPVKLRFGVPMQTSDEKGLPEPIEIQQLDVIEAVILRELQSRAKGVFALMLMGFRKKEFVFYVPRETDFPELHKAVRVAVSTHEVLCLAEFEPRWDFYQQFSIFKQQPDGL